MKKLIFLCLMLSLVGFFVYQKLNTVSEESFTKSQRETAVKNILGRALQKEHISGTRHYSGPYISCDYPAFLIRDTRDSAVAKKITTVRDLFELRDVNTHLFIAIQGIETDLRSLDDETGVTIRRKQANLYSEQKISVSGLPGVLFTRNQDGAEKTVFVLSHGTLYSLAATAQNMVRIDSVLPGILKTLTLR